MVEGPRVKSSPAPLCCLHSLFEMSSSIYLAFFLSFKKKLRYNFHILKLTLFNVMALQVLANVHGDVTPTTVKIQNIAITPRPLYAPLHSNPLPHA